jgi:hypothetical protein
MLKIILLNLYHNKMKLLRVLLLLISSVIMTYYSRRLKTKYTNLIAINGEYTELEGVKSHKTYKALYFFPIIPIFDDVGCTFPYIILHKKLKIDEIHIRGLPDDNKVTLKENSNYYLYKIRICVNDLVLYPDRYVLLGLSSKGEEYTELKLLFGITTLDDGEYNLMRGEIYLIGGGSINASNAIEIRKVIITKRLVFLKQLKSHLRNIVKNEQINDKELKDAIYLQAIPELRTDVINYIESPHRDADDMLGKVIESIKRHKEILNAFEQKEVNIIIS